MEIFEHTIRAHLSRKNKHFIQEFIKWMMKSWLNILYVFKWDKIWPCCLFFRCLCLCAVNHNAMDFTNHEENQKSGFHFLAGCVDVDFLCVLYIHLSWLVQCKWQFYRDIGLAIVIRIISPLPLPKKEAAENLESAVLPAVSQLRW